MSWFDSLLWPIMVVVAWIMVQAHALLSPIFGEDSGTTWVLSIVVLVILMRAALIPLFVRQIKSSRGLQMLQPEMKKIQDKYKGKTDPASRQKMSEETMALYRKNGTNPLSSCWPILLQSPIFFALFRVLNSLVPLSEGAFKLNGKPRASIGPLDQVLAASAEKSTLFGAPLSSTFMRADEVTAPTSPMTVRIVTVLLIVAMSATTFTTQRQLTMKNMPQTALDNPMARQQRMMMYMMPLIFAFSGINFPIGVLIYWLTTNLWTMGQQFFVIRRMPSPGSEAARRLEERKKRKAGLLGKAEPVEEIEAPEQPKGGQRAQPKRKDRGGRKGELPAPKSQIDPVTGEKPGQAAGKQEGRAGGKQGGAVSDDAATTQREPGSPTSDSEESATSGESGQSGRLPTPGQRSQPKSKKRKKK